jgi:alpha-tubulin suppressor-like RCC1 family protein
VRVNAVSAGWTHTCGVRTYGTFCCWGNNRWGQLGDGTGGNKDTPTQVSGANWVSVSAFCF